MSTEDKDNGKRLKLLNRSSLYKLTIFTSAVSLVSGFSLKSSTDATANTEAVESNKNVQKETVQQKMERVVQNRMWCLLF